MKLKLGDGLNIPIEIAGCRCGDAHSGTAVSDPFVSELLRLNSAQVAAKKAGDAETADALAHEIALLLRYNSTGRLAEHWARKEQP